MSDKSSPATPPSKPPVRQRTRTVQPAPAEHTPIERTGTAKSQSPAGDDYKVGYRNPPKHSQFQPGFDARRPKGRKAGAKNKANVIVAMMESPTPLRTPDGELRIVSTAEAMARKLRELGLSGDRVAIIKAFELHLKALPPTSPEAEDKDAPSEQTPAELSAADKAILAAFEEEIIARRKL